MAIATVNGQQSEFDAVASTLSAWSRRFDVELDRLLRPSPGAAVPDELVEAMRYTALAPGKRLRPFLACVCCRLVGGREDAAWPAAAAIECVHAFSLIHDDLPSMDDDAIRRGQAANHVRFGEGLAILAGDALLALAFELLVSDRIEPARTVAMVLELARATGRAGMIGGQADDIAAGPDLQDRDLRRSIHARKTGRLMESACRLGAICGAGSPGRIDSLGRYGLALGIAFQIADDLLDLDPPTDGLAGATDSAGPVEADAQFAEDHVGIVEAQRPAWQASCNAVAALQTWGTEADELRALARFVIERKS